MPTEAAGAPVQRGKAAHAFRGACQVVLVQVCTALPPAWAAVPASAKGCARPKGCGIGGGAGCKNNRNLKKSSLSRPVIEYHTFDHLCSRTLKHTWRAVLMMSFMHSGQLHMLSENSGLCTMWHHQQAFDSWNRLGR